MPCKSTIVTQTTSTHNNKIHPDIRKHAHFFNIYYSYAKDTSQSQSNISKYLIYLCLHSLYTHTSVWLAYLYYVFAGFVSAATLPLLPHPLTHRHTYVYCQQIIHRLCSCSRSLASFRQLLVIYNTHFRRVLARSIYQLQILQDIKKFVFRIGQSLQMSAFKSI